MPNVVSVRLLITYTNGRTSKGWIQGYVEIENYNSYINGSVDFLTFTNGINFRKKYHRSEIAYIRKVE